MATYYLSKELEEKAKLNRDVGSIQRRTAGGVEREIRYGVLSEPLRLAGQIIALMSGDDDDEKDEPGK